MLGAQSAGSEEVLVALSVSFRYLCSLLLVPFLAQEALVALVVELVVRPVTPVNSELELLGLQMQPLEFRELVQLVQLVVEKRLVEPLELVDFLKLPLELPLELPRLAVDFGSVGLGQANQVEASGALGARSEVG